jgi:hypothetical protein
MTKNINSTDLSWKKKLRLFCIFVLVGIFSSFQFFYQLPTTHASGPVTAAITYSKDGCATFASTISVKHLDNLCIKATFSEPMADSPITKIAIDNGVLSAVNMSKITSTAYDYPLTVPTGDIATATVSLSVGQDAADGTVITASPSSGATFTIDNTAPTSQDTVFTNAISKESGSAVVISSSGDASNEVWFAPTGTSVFVAGTNMTKATTGTSTSILAPTDHGTYYIYVVDAAGNISSHSSAALTVTNLYTITASGGSNGTITPLGITTKDSGSSQTYTITAVSGYHVENVLVDGFSQGAISTYTFSNILTNHTISATFLINSSSSSSHSSKSKTKIINKVKYKIHKADIKYKTKVFNTKEIQGQAKTAFYDLAKKNNIVVTSFSISPNRIKASIGRPTKISKVAATKIIRNISLNLLNKLMPLKSSKLK